MENQITNHIEEFLETFEMDETEFSKIFCKDCDFLQKLYAEDEILSEAEESFLIDSMFDYERNHYRKIM